MLVCVCVCVCVWVGGWVGGCVRACVRACVNRMSLSYDFGGTVWILNTFLN